MFLEFIQTVSKKNVLISLDEISAVIEHDEGCTIELKNGNFYHFDTQYKDVYNTLNNLPIM